MSEQDKRRLQAQARDLAAVECDDELGADEIRRTLDAANQDRERDGRPPLDADADAFPPEAKFYERARALGLRRISR